MKKGFTLVELLAILVILGLVGLLVYPAIEKTVKGVRTDLYQNQKSAMINGLKNWVVDHPRSLPEENGEVVYVSLGQLKIGSYVDMFISDPKTDKLFDNATKIVIKRQNGKYKYEVLLDDETLVEYEKNVNITYPNVQFQGKEVVYLSVNDTYIDEGLVIDGEKCSNGNCGNVTFDFSNIDTSVKGSYYAKYIIYGLDDLVIYRTVIVK